MLHTVFEEVWNDSTTPFLFRSDKHKVMAIADKFPRMPLQVVIAPASGNPGEIVHFHDLNEITQDKLWTVGKAIGKKILSASSSPQRSMFTLEGFAVEDHAHLIYYAGVRREGINRYTGELLGDLAVQRTVEAITLSLDESIALESKLDGIG